MRKLNPSNLWCGLLLLALASQAAAAENAPNQDNAGQRPPHGPPPQVAIDACAKLTEGASCSFTGRRNDNVSGTCHTPPQQSSLACVPSHRPMQQQPPSDDNGPSRGY